MASGNLQLNGLHSFVSLADERDHDENRRNNKDQRHANRARDGCRRHSPLFRQPLVHRKKQNHQNHRPRQRCKEGFKNAKCKIGENRDNSVEKRAAKLFLSSRSRAHSFSAFDLKPD